MIHKAHTSLLSSLLAFAAVFLVVAPADAQPRAGAAQNAQGPSSQATLLASFGDWGAYASQVGRGKICYALSQPKERLPKALKRDPAYLFVSIRPAENVRNEVSVVSGFPMREGAEGHQAQIGSSNFVLVAKDENAWIKNPAEEIQVITAMARAKDMSVKITSRRGNETTDRYSLNGFDDALKRAREECR